MIIKPYIPKQKLSKLKVGDEITIERNTYYTFTIRGIDKIHKTIRLEEIYGAFDADCFDINVEE